ncbi:DUF4421 domain-containing protein [Muriicola jejuensis]|uniref:DUF4421 domain-containing protein n=1 Tax=Muriicola jejuensis TaxID=504488 RepID=A0A6P0U8L3_9FLAO|nr:DUF4421 domain-containing protein [Muriicola jejuensis]
MDKILLKVNVDTQTESYSVKSENSSDFRLETNNQLELSLSLDYDFIGVSIGFSPKFLPGNNENELKGESTYQDFSFRFFIGQWTQTLQYKNVKSFYVENTEDFIPSWIKGQDPYIQFPDFETIFWGGATSFVLNPNFSLRNVVYNTEWQLKSAGSLIPTLRYGYTNLILESDDSNSFEKSFDISLSPDYYYTYVFQKNWFASLFLSPGLGIRFSTAEEEGVDAPEKKTSWPISFDGGLQLGYSSSKIIFGGNFNFETTWYTSDNTTNITNNSLYAKVYVGYRFDAPRIVKKIVHPRKKKRGS